jgi:hypothetical protein
MFGTTRTVQSSANARRSSSFPPTAARQEAQPTVRHHRHRGAAAQPEPGEPLVHRPHEQLREPLHDSFDVVVPGLLSGITGDGAAGGHEAAEPPLERRVGCAAEQLHGLEDAVDSQGRDQPDALFGWRGGSGGDLSHLAKEGRHCPRRLGPRIRPSRRRPSVRHEEDQRRRRCTDVYASGRARRKS